MSSPTESQTFPRKAFAWWDRALRALIMFLAWAAGGGLMIMVVVTSVDVVLRKMGLSLTGAYDVVKMAALITVAGALPYTTAIKGHVAIEFFFHKLGRRGRALVDALMRICGMALFALLAGGCFSYGHSLREKGEVSMTLHFPIFWAPYVLGASCGLVVLIKLHHLLRPGRPMIQP